MILKAYPGYLKTNTTGFKIGLKVYNLIDISGKRATALQSK